MITKDRNIIKGRVTNEGDELYYEVRGQGKPLLLISAGEGDSYLAIANILSDEYKVITYDRRANGRSTMNNPQNFEISQQSRDAVAVLNAAGETSAFVLGSSAGAVIALDMAKNYPEAVQAVVAHEVPAARLHPKSQKWQRLFASTYLSSLRFGSPISNLRLMFKMQLPIRQMLKANDYLEGLKEKDNEPRISTKDAADVSVKLELLPVTNYLPDVEQLKRNKVKIFIAVGEWSLKKKTWYAVATKILAEKLGCELLIFPGHHGSYMDMSVEWAAVLRNALHKAEDKTGDKE